MENKLFCGKCGILLIKSIADAFLHKKQEICVFDLNKILSTFQYYMRFRKSKNLFNFTTYPVLLNKLLLPSVSIFKSSLLYSNKFHIKKLNTLNGQIIKRVTTISEIMKLTCR